MGTGLHMDLIEPGLLLSRLVQQLSVDALLALAHAGRLLALQLLLVLSHQKHPVLLLLVPFLLFAVLPLPLLLLHPEQQRLCELLFLVSACHAAHLKIA